MLLFLEKQAGGFWEPSKKQSIFGTRGAMDKNVLILTEEFQLMLAVDFLGENLSSLVCDQ
jgi:hypothetical protein